VSHVDILRVDVTHVHPRPVLHNTQNVTHTNKNAGRPAVSLKLHSNDTTAKDMMHLFFFLSFEFMTSQVVNIRHFFHFMFLILVLMNIIYFS